MNFNVKIRQLVEKVLMIFSALLRQACVRRRRRRRLHGMYCG